LEDTIDEIPVAPSGAGGRIVGRLDTEPTFEYILEFGPEGQSGHYVMRGTFDLAGLDVGDPTDEVGEFEVFDAAGESVAASSDTLVVVDPEVGSIDDVLAAGLDGTDRRVDGDGPFGTVLEQLGDDTLGFGVVPESSDGVAVGNSWAIDSETTTYTQVMTGAGSSELNEDQLESELATESPFDRLDAFSIDIEDNTVIATGSVPTTDFRYTDSISKTQAGTGRPVRASISIAVETAAQSVTVVLASVETGAHVEVRDGDGTQATLTERGEEVTLEYEVGETETISVVVIEGDQESVITTETVEF